MTNAETIDAILEEGSDAYVASTKPFAELIRMTRESKDWSQQKLASESGLSHSTVYRIERGKPPDDETRRKLLSALGLVSHGQPMAALNLRQLPSERRAEKPSAMGQLIGQMMMRDGAPGQDPYAVLIEVATERDDPPEVFKALARARSDAPPTADWGWWVSRYVDAVSPKKS